MPQQANHWHLKHLWRLLAALVVVVFASLPVTAEDTTRSPDYMVTKIQLSPVPDRQPITFDVRLATTPFYCFEH